MKNATVKTLKEVWVFRCISNITLNPFLPGGERGCARTACVPSKADGLHVLPSKQGWS